MKRLFSALVLTVAAAACGGSSSPTAPAPAGNAAPTATTAVINGTIAGGTSASLFNTTNGAGAGITVTIEGTNIQATVNGAGQFVLANVPAGTPIVLRFNGAGANAVLSIGVVNAGQTVTITVVVNGNVAALQEKTQGSDKEIEGRIESIQGSTLIVATRTVLVTPATVIRHGGTSMTLAQLQVGQRVHVKGTVTGTGATASTTATQINVQNMNTSIGVELEGTVSGLTGTASAFQFVVDGRTVRGGASTEFKGGTSPSFARLANGDKVHVKGTLQEGFVFAQRINLQDEDDDADEFEARGVVSGLSGTCPAITFTLNGTTVRASSSTEFEHGTCASIANGDTVKVEGTRQADGSVIAKEIEGDEEDDEDDDAQRFEARGAVAGLSGTCPAIAFTLNGTIVRATASTEYEHITCQAIANGTQVKVEGTKQTDGSVVASEITKG